MGEEVLSSEFWVLSSRAELRTSLSAFLANSELQTQNSELRIALLARLPLIGGSAAHIFSPHTVEDLSLHLAQLTLGRLGRGFKHACF